MPKKLSSKLAEIKHVVQLHANWLVYATLGKDSISKEEFKQLENYKKLPMGSLDFVDKSYLLGRLKALFKKSEYSDVSYEQVVEQTDKATFSALEELVLAQAKLKAGIYLKSISDDIQNGVYAALSLSLGQAISESTVQDAVADEVQTAIIQKKTAQQLASSLAARLQTDSKKKWLVVATTELQRAKVSGYSQAIINKIGIYTNSDGPNSNVCVVPSKNCCEDCSALYLDKSGNPKIFKLIDLVYAGTNADSGVSHVKKNGKHVKWKVTLPPLHPSCGCLLMYVPPGHSMVGGKLTLVDKALFESTLSKAQSGVSGGISPTVQPAGAAANKTESGKMPSVAGVAAPGNVAGPGRPPGLKPPGEGGGGGGNDTTSCPFGGGDDCMKHGGNGAATHKMSGSIMKRHQEAMANGAEPADPAAKERQQKAEEAQAASYSKEPHPPAEIANHLSEGKISSAKELSGPDAGAHKAYKVTIAGNGAGCMKPPPAFPDTFFIGSGYADGAANMPKDSGQISEQAAYHLSSALGLTDHVPVTVLRNHDGQSGISHQGEMSVQSWKEGWKQPESHPTMKDAESIEEVLALVPKEHKEKLKQKLHEVAVLDIVMNNNDRHMQNLVFSPDMSDFSTIDHGLSFGTGMQGHKNGIHKNMGSDPLSIPDHLHTKFKNQSFDQTKRQLEKSGLKDWQVAQTHLRMKYVSHIQAQHGHIPPEVTRYAYSRAEAESQEWASMLSNVPRYKVPEGKGWEASAEKRGQQVNKATEDWEMPDQLFATFAKSYINGDISSDLSDSDRATLAKMKPAHPAGTGFHENRDDEAHSAYWDSIPAYKPMSSWAAATEDQAAPPLRTSPEVSGDGDKAKGEMSGDKTKAKGGAKGEMSGDKTKAKGKKPSGMGTDPTLKPDGSKPRQFELDRTNLKLEDDGDLKFNDDEIHLSDEDMEEVSQDEEVDDAFDKIRQPKTKKSLFLFDTAGRFPYTTLDDLGKR